MKNPLKRLMIKGYSIQYIIAISTIFVALFPMIYTGISIFEKYSDQIIENSKVSTGQIMEQLKINIDDYLARSISSHNDIEGLLVKNENIINPVLQTNLNMYFSSRNDIVSISLFDAEGNPISVVPNLILREDLSITKESWFKKVLDGSILYYI